MLKLLLVFAFNQSYSFMRARCDLETSQWSINSTSLPIPPTTQWNLAPNWIALGNNNIYFGTSGVHPRCLSLYYSFKYYFCHLEIFQETVKGGILVSQSMVQLLILIMPQRFLKLVMLLMVKLHNLLYSVVQQDDWLFVMVV